MVDVIDWLLSLTGQLESWILGFADAWWVHLVVYLFAAFDGFFPSVPSESTIVTLSSLWSTAGRPSIILIGLAAWLGAWTGDNVGYLIGSKIGWERFRFLREGRGRRAVDAADRGLQKRALLFLMTARYIPFGRTAVNLVAGAVHYPHRHFWPRSLLSTFVWAVYSCAIGALAGAWFEHNPLLGITIALIAAMIMALLLERMIAMTHRLLDRRAERLESEQAQHSGAGTERVDDHEEAQVPVGAPVAAPVAAEEPRDGGPADASPPAQQQTSAASAGAADSPSTLRGEQSPA